jgi:hypothetical protein
MKTKSPLKDLTLIQIIDRFAFHPDDALKCGTYAKPPKV